MCLLEKLSHTDWNKLSEKEISSVDVRNTFTSVCSVKLKKCFDPCPVSIREKTYVMLSWAQGNVKWPWPKPRDLPFSFAACVLLRTFNLYSSVSFSYSHFHSTFYSDRSVTGQIMHWACPKPLLWSPSSIRTGLQQEAILLTIFPSYPPHF